MPTYGCGKIRVAYVFMSEDSMKQRFLYMICPNNKKTKNYMLCDMREAAQNTQIISEKREAVHSSNFKIRNRKVKQTQKFKLRNH
jgi:hypothetical protein